MPLSADEIRWQPASTPWPSSAQLLGVVIEVIPTIQDDLAADLLEELALALVERDEALNAVGFVQSVALERVHQLHREMGRLRLRLTGLQRRSHDR